MDSLQGGEGTLCMSWITQNKGSRKRTIHPPHTCKDSAEGTEVVGGWAPFRHSCAPCFIREQHLSFTCAKTHSVAHPLYSHCPKVRSDFEPADTELDWILPEIKMFSLLKSRLSSLSVNSGRSLRETYSFHAKSCSHSNFQGFSPVNRKNPVCVHVNMLETDYCMTLK